MCEKSVCYVTAFLDLNRGEWPIFKRSFEEYLEAFKSFLDLFDDKKCGDDEMICFIDEKRQSQCEAIFDKEKNVKITLISLTEDMRNELHCWRTLYKEQENMNQPSFQALLKNRQGFPETRYASYTCINHCKIDFVCRVIDQNLSAKEFLCWIDFGYFMKTINIPKKLLDVDKMDIDKFN